MQKTIVPKASTHEEDTKTMFGFWIYLMTDLILFASLFATYAVLRTNTNGGEGAGQLFSLPYVLIETLLLLTSSFTSGLALLAVHRNKKQQALVWLGVTFVLGAAFLGMELVEFTKLVQEGNSWTRSGFLSAYFTLVGTHGLHITAGLLWLSVLVVMVLRRGLTSVLVKRLALFSLFWHFLDIVWIFIFTIVYLLGVTLE
jgi:cytochrome o ubiquinol oxidase subunit III